jgi:RNA polymerase sigma-70 factor (ECF subfamily)
VSGKVATTQWSQVLAARDGSDSEAGRALENLCQTYWQPLYAYVRHQGADPDEASDLTQTYFAELLEKDLLAEADPSKGRLRAYLLATLRNFLSRERAKSRRQKRGGGSSTLSLDLSAGEKRYAAHTIEKMTPEDVFAHRWAVTVLDRALARLEREARSSGEEERFRHLKPYLTSDDPQRPYRQTAATLGMSEGAVKVAVHRLRKRFGKALRLQIAETVEDPADVDDEVRYLLGVVRRCCVGRKRRLRRIIRTSMRSRSRSSRQFAAGVAPVPGRYSTTLRLNDGKKVEMFVDVVE